MWTVEYSPRALKQLRKLDAGQRKLLLAWIDKNLQGCANPRAIGKPLKGSLADEWRYRFGDYRILCDIQDERLVILALNIDHRSRVYRQK